MGGATCAAEDRRWKAVARRWRCMGMGEGKGQQGGDPRKRVWRRLPRAPVPEVAEDGEVFLTAKNRDSSENR